MKSIDRLSLVRPRPDESRRRAGPPPPSRARGAVPPTVLILFDLATLATTFWLAVWITPMIKAFLLTQTGPRLRWIGLLSPQATGELLQPASLAWTLLVMAASTILLMQGVGGYRPLVRQSRTAIVLSAVGSQAVGLAVITLILFALRLNTWSRLFLFVLAALGSVGLSGYRLALRWYRLRRIASGFHARNVIVIGPPRALGWLATHMARNTSRQEYDVVGYLSVTPVQTPIEFDGPSGSGVLPCLGDVGRLSALLLNRPVDEVIAIQGTDQNWLLNIVETCDYFRITLRIVPETLVFGELRDLEILYHSDPLRLPEVVLQPRHVGSTGLFLKRMFDLVVSGVLLVLLAPLFAVIALAIKLTTPALPVLYRWRVVGQNGRRFTGYKFTTMSEDADERKHELQARNEMHGPVFKIRDDPRVTRLGRWLRKFSLNELPQLVSVVKGDMSLVGPRPAFPHEVERYELWHKRKLAVRPGITCLWQVRGRNAITRFDDWVKMDLEYIDNWSLWLDVKILIWTVRAVVRGTGW